MNVLGLISQLIIIETLRLTVIKVIGLLVRVSRANGKKMIHHQPVNHVHNKVMKAKGMTKGVQF